MIRTLVLGALGLLAAPAASGADAALAAWLATDGRHPADYVLAKLEAHPIVLVGEGHWLRADVRLIAETIPGLRRRRAALAMETLAASEQANVDRLITAPAWDAALATAVLRASAWPYRDYRDMLHAAWLANRDTAGGRPLKVLALGPPADWRQSLMTRGETYDGFMAKRVIEHLGAEKGRVLIYCGMHHAFTRYHQAELDLEGRALGYNDRAGNMLWRRYGARVFLIALHKPVWCGSPDTPGYCLPFDGAVDCAAAKAGRPVGFDVVGSPFAALAFPDSHYYRYGHPGLRFADYTDGYVWTGPVEDARNADLIPFAEYAPDTASVAQVARRNPFSDEPGLPRERLERLWREEIEANERPLEKRRWAHLRGWRERCR